MTTTLIVGGGLAGAAAAALLATAKRQTLVLEREREPSDKICGEFLSAEARAHLTALGLDIDALGGAPTHTTRIVSGRSVVESRLPFTALGLTRRRLDEALLQHAADLGAAVERGVAVRSIAPAGKGGAVVETSAGPLTTGRLLLASGKHDVRGGQRDRAAAQALGDMVGFKSHFRLSRAQAAAMAGCIEVVLFDGGYAGLQTVENGLVNLCLVLQRTAFHAAGRNWEGVMRRLMTEPHLARRLGDAEAVSPRPLTVSNIPYGFVHRTGDGPTGVWRLGDQAVVIPSFSGDGMAIALHSARLAALTLIQGGEADAYHARLAADVGAQVRLAVFLQRRAQGWPGRSAVMRGLRLVPDAVARLAAWTRVPEIALRRAGL